ncbi:hypothetical protein [Sphingobium sp. C100]|uniref:hypothetical protein n=1 Tax=Sphingobium sp. C100 TaxID=1207055 RepID=UPI0004048B49|nr:hypothetical protein [Sphingobium sp. C100]
MIITDRIDLWESNMMCRKSAAVLLIGLALSADGAFARTSQSTTSAKLFDDLVQCRSVSGGDDRLACYDRAVTAMQDAQSKNEMAVIDKDSVRQAKRQQFGLNAFAASQLDSKSEGGVDDLDEIQSTIVGVDPLARGRWLLRLGDGSQWQTVEAVAYRVPKANMAVTVKRAALGTFLIRPTGWPAVRARRIK